MKVGTLEFEPVDEHIELVAEAVKTGLKAIDSSQVFVAQTDPELADTENFCKAYEVGLDMSANCVVVRAKRADRVWYVALMILATDMADVNKTVKKHIDARKLSFAPTDKATELTQMAYGGITPIGLPEDWQILVDEKVANSDQLIIGSGIRGSKLVTSGQILVSLPNAEVIDMAIKQ